MNEKRIERLKALEEGLIATEEALVKFIIRTAEEGALTFALHAENHIFR